MMTFDPKDHPRGHITNAGAFSDKLNSDPEAGLGSSVYADLIAEAQAAAKSYYDGTDETMTDAEYDSLLDRIADYEQSHPEVVPQHDLLTAVAGGVSAGGAVVHDSPMLSLDKATTKAEVAAFVAKVEAAGGTVRAEPKLDGLAINVTYTDGKLTRVGTRGDGHSGEDITEQIRNIGPANLPTTIPQADGKVNIRGELLMTADDFEKSNAARQASGKPAFANPRNAAAGSIRSTSLNYKVNLTFVSYGVVGAPENEIPGLLLAQDIPFDRDGDVLDQVDAFGMERKSGDFPYPTDGIVLKAEDDGTRELLGEGNRAPKWAVAYKYAADRATTKLLGIETAVGRTGAISFTAVLEPVEVDGSVVARATLHNPAFIADNDLRIGDVVEVYKAGEIIPRVVRSFPESRGADSVPYEPSTVSPSGYPLNMDGAIWRSTDPSESIGALFAYATSRDVFDIDGLGPEVADALAKGEKVNDLGDFFNLTQADLAGLELAQGRLLGDKTAAKIYANIQTAKEQPLNRVITSLGIRKSGRTFGRRLAAEFGSMDALLAASQNDFFRVEGVGEERARFFYEGFQKNAPVIAKMRAAGVKMEHTAAAAGGAASSASLNGARFVVTGGMTGVLASKNRNEVQELIAAAGGVPSGSVSKTTDYLVAGGDESTSSKYLKAQELGVKIIDPETLAGMLGLS